MFTLQSSPEEIISAPLMMANQMCRTTIRVRRWNDATMCELLSRPVQSVVVDACLNIQQKLWHQCDTNLQAAIIAYLERNHG